jgi:hypothetical protein
MEPPRIGLWGWYNAGKTSYLVALYRHVAIHETPWRMQPTDVASEDFIENNACRFLPGGQLPAKTDNMEVKNYEFQMVKNGGWQGQRAYRLTVIDPRGRHTSINNDSFGYFEALQKCHGVMCLIDPEYDKSARVHRPIAYEGKEPQSYLELLERLFRKLVRDEQGYVRPNIAFCVSKIDLDDEWKHRDKIAEHCESIIGPQACQLIKNYCASHRRKFFAVSAVGRYKFDGPTASAPSKPSGKERPNLEPAGDTFCIADVEKWEPFGLLEPIDWLFGRIEDDQGGRTGFGGLVRWAFGRP